MEIGVLNHIAKTFEDAYIAQEKQLKSWLEEQKKIIEDTNDKLYMNQNEIIVSITIIL